MIKSILIAGVGGFAGTVLRFLISRYIQLHYVTVFPWGTFLVNIAGSFIIGVLYGISEKGNFLSSEWRLFATVGFCGGFTTFSSFSNDSLILLQNKEFLNFAFYSGLSFFLGLIAVLAGRISIRLL